MIGGTIAEVVKTWAAIVWRRLAPEDQRALIRWFHAAQELPEWEKVSPALRRRIEEVVEWLSRL